MPPGVHMATPGVEADSGRKAMMRDKGGLQQCLHSAKGSVVGRRDLASPYA